MAEETVVAESSAAATETPKFTQFDGWDEEGTPVVTKKEESPTRRADALAQREPKSAAAAAADASKETKTDDAADSAAKKTQEKHRKPDAEARIRELTDKLRQRDRELEEARKPKETKAAESSTAKADEQKPAQPEATRPKPTQNDKGPDGKAKYPSYEDWVEDLADWKAEQRLAAQQREHERQQLFNKVKGEVEDARKLYSDYDQKATSVYQELMKPDVSPVVFDALNKSTVLPHVLYALGGSEATKADFLDACRNDPVKALYVLFEIQNDVQKELAKGKAAAKKDGEGEAEHSPAPPKPRAPKPPTEVGGRGAPGEDALISAAKTGDFRSFSEEQTRRAMASRR